ncbi:MAG: winged helix-turn-helix domain-containing protein [Chloroflexota bacterium]|nr:winged helix-turn-helix domain-containing protein [Chloroflexota bacterium]
MAVPDQSVFTRAVLDALHEAPPEGWRTGDVREVVESRFVFSRSDLSELTSGISTTKVISRVNWAVQYLYAAGVLDRPSRGRYLLNKEGRRLLKSAPVKIDSKYLSKRYPAFATWSRSRRRREPKRTDVTIEQLAARVESLERLVAKVTEQLEAIARAASRDGGSP